MESRAGRDDAAAPSAGSRRRRRRARSLERRSPGSPADAVGRRSARASDSFVVTDAGRGAASRPDLRRGGRPRQSRLRAVDQRVRGRSPIAVRQRGDLPPPRTRTRRDRRRTARRSTGRSPYWWVASAATMQNIMLAAGRRGPRLRLRRHRRRAARQGGDLGLAPTSSRRSR